MDLVALIQQVGFPIAVASWLLFSHGKKLDRVGDGLDRIERLLAVTAQGGIQRPSALPAAQVQEVK